MKKRIISLLLLFIMLIGALPVSAINTSGILHIPINYHAHSAYYSKNDYKTHFSIHYKNTTNKTITDIQFIWYPCDTWGNILYNNNCNYLVSTANDLNVEPGTSNYNSWSSTLSVYKNIEDNMTDVIVSRVKFSDGTIWENNGHFYAEADFTILNQQTSDGRYLVNPDNPMIYVEETGKSVFSTDWYVWNDGTGWTWFDDFYSSGCERWTISSSVKLIINENPDLYKIKDFSLTPRPTIYCTPYGTNCETIKIGSNNKTSSIKMPDSAALPYNLGLWDGSGNPYIKSRCWYIWSDAENNFIPFSTEKGPICQLWSEGAHTIKLVYNNDPNYYTLWTVIIGKNIESEY